MIVAWVAFPLVFGALALGSGLLVERASAVTVPGTLLAPLGFALIVVVTQIATSSDATAELATPLVMLCALGGLVVGRARLRVGEVDRWALAAALAVFAIFGAPIFLSGDATFAGYTLLGDTSIHFLLIDRVMEHARDLSGLDPSSYRSALDGYFDSAYPLGSHTALGAMRPLVGEDVAWIFQPYLAGLAALTALTLNALLLPAVRSAPLRALAAFVAAQPALVYAYSLQGSIKELATILIVAVLVATVPLALALRSGLSRLLPLSIATAAALGILSLAVAPWLGPLLLACFVAGVWRQPRERQSILKQAGVFVAATAVLALPTLTSAGSFTRATKGVLTAPNEFGNLIGPLDGLQVFGIWPSGDFRFSPSATSLDLTHILIVVAAAAVLLGLAWAIRARSVAPLLYVGVSLIGWAVATSRGSPWADAKALTIFSPAVMLAAMLGAVGLFAWKKQLPAIAIAGVVAFGVLWSNAVAYHDVDLAPRDRLDELSRIGDRLEGGGPTLYVEFEEFAKYFLRDGAPTGRSEAWQPNAERGPYGLSEDIDSVPLGDVLRYRSLVLRRSPSASRPPTAFTKTYTGRYYEVWQRDAGRAGAALAHMSLGDSIQPGGVPRCEALARLANSTDHKRARLAYVPRSPLPYLVPATRPLPKAWTVDRTDKLSVQPSGPGRIDGPVRVQRAGARDVWVQGSFGRATDVQVDGKRVGAISYELNPRGQFVDVGRVVLSRGRHTVSLVRAGGDLHPGNGGSNRLIGPVVLGQESDARRVAELPATAFKRLCGRNLDWVELVQG